MVGYPNDRDRDYPADRDAVAEPDRTHVRETHVREKKSSTGIAAVVGGLVVAVLLIFWLVGGFGAEEAEIAETDVIVGETEEVVGTGVEGEMAPISEGELGAVGEDVEPIGEAEIEAVPEAEEEIETVQ